MRAALTLALLTCAFVALACKDLRYPEHLADADHADQWYRDYMLVDVERVQDSILVSPTSYLAVGERMETGDATGVIGTSFKARIVRSFGVVDRAGQRVLI